MIISFYLQEVGDEMASTHRVRFVEQKLPLGYRLRCGKTNNNRAKKMFIYFNNDFYTFYNFANTNHTQHVSPQ